MDLPDELIAHQLYVIGLTGRLDAPLYAALCLTPHSSEKPVSTPLSNGGIIFTPIGF